MHSQNFILFLSMRIWIKLAWTKDMAHISRLKWLPILFPDIFFGPFIWSKFPNLVKSQAIQRNPEITKLQRFTRYLRPILVFMFSFSCKIMHYVKSLKSLFFKGIFASISEVFILVEGRLGAGLSFYGL